MEKQQILELIGFWRGRVMATGGIARDKEDSLHTALTAKPIKVISGFRRSGKSFLAQRIARRAIDDGRYPIKNLLYLNFEDFRLTEFQNAAAFYELFTFFKSTTLPGRRLVLLDEIQLVTDWEKVVRTIYESEPDTDLMLTGSNSSLLSSELGSNLAGRFLEFHIHPFSFKEMLIFRGVTIADAETYYRRKDEVDALFHEYLSFGGLPEVLAIPSEETKLSYLRGVVSKVILDDVIKRYKVKNPAAVESIVQYLLLNVGNQVAAARITAHLQKSGQELKESTVLAYIGYILSTFALYEASRFDWKTSRVFETTRKYYAVDTGLSVLYGGVERNFSRLLENVAYGELARRGRTIHYGALAKGGEIDFVTDAEGGGTPGLIQVTQTLNEENRRREIGVFAAIDRHLAKGEKLLLSTDPEEGPFVDGGTTIVRKNIVRWLLDLS